MDLKTKLLRSLEGTEKTAQGIIADMDGRSGAEAFRLNLVSTHLVAEIWRYRSILASEMQADGVPPQQVTPAGQMLIKFTEAISFPDPDEPESEPDPVKDEPEPEPVRKHVFVPFYPSSIRGLDRNVRARNTGLGLGDIMFGLAPFKAVGGGEFHITCFNPPFRWAESHPYSDAEYRERTYHNLAAYIDAQPYITLATARSYDNSEGFDLDFDNVRHHWNRCITEDIGQLEVYHDYVGSTADLSERWLEPTTDPDEDLSNAVIINMNDRRTCEHLDHRVLEDVENVIFVGLEREYRYFCARWRMEPEFRTAKDFFELTTWLYSCKVFIGCSSMMIVLADGLNSNRIFCQWPTRPYFRTYGGNHTTVLTQEGYVDALYKFGVLA
tara:strand:+ start:258 stop:1406 length:1149 start_codon:yes stop_codon:yes gene_type:complete